MVNSKQPETRLNPDVPRQGASMARLGAARAWMVGGALLAAGLVWLVRR
jgi:hypothetical protein